MPILACCIKAKFYAKSSLLYSKGDLYVSDVGIRLPHVYYLAYSAKFHAKVINCHNQMSILNLDVGM